MTILVVENDVWSPDSVVRQTDGFNVSEVGEVPGEVSVIPFLEQGLHVQLGDVYLNLFK